MPPQGSTSFPSVPWRFCLVTLAAMLSALGEEPLPDTARLKSSPVLRQLVSNPVKADSLVGPQSTIASMYVPEGFQVELIAGEPRLHQPIAFAFDERGRIWVAEAYSYPSKRPPGEGKDRLVIFEDADGNGSFESFKVFVEGLNLVSGFELGYGGVWVGAAPELLFIPDRDGDDLPDSEPQVLLDGFGYQDTHECLNSFHWGPDGWLYGNQGVFNFARIGKPGSEDSERQELRAGVWRYHPLRHEFEIFAYGGSNQWGLDHDEHGELFMTHCRSYWGRGPTTHVIQGGHYWNQANANHAPFIISRPPDGYPELRNYLLASARYGHGAGGAGPRGSDMIYGGHSHVGTMIYYGDNWPEIYRGKLFTHNLGGHQINQQINQRFGSGYDTIHAGNDVLFCSDPKYVAVDLQYGPDGAVYFIDWYDRQHCHNPNDEQWDRGNGRLYRMQFAETYQPRPVNLFRLTDHELVDFVAHPNAWYFRAASKVLHQRSRERSLAPAVVNHIHRLATTNDDPLIRLRGLWLSHGLAGRGDESLLLSALRDSDEFVRAWSIQLSAEDRMVPEDQMEEWKRMAKSDPSPLVRRYLASAMQRVPDESAWDLAEALVSHQEDREDRNLPYIIWQGIAPRLAGDWDRAFRLARLTRLPRMAEFIHWYASVQGGDALNRVIAELDRLEGDDLQRRMAAVWLAFQNRENAPMPDAWPTVAPRLYQHDNTGIQRTAEQLAATFGDRSRFDDLRSILSDRQVDKAKRTHAFEVLSRARDAQSLDVFLNLLLDSDFQSKVLPVLARFSDDRIAATILKEYSRFSRQDQGTALNVLISRANFALELLLAISENKLGRDLLTAYHVRQLNQLRNEEIDAQVAKHWGAIAQTPKEMLNRIETLEGIFNEAPLWAYSANAGRVHYQNLCASCHVVGELGTRLGPDLTGAGKNGIRYYLENIIDPNAVIGTDYQMTTVETQSGEVISGVVKMEDAESMVIQTAVGESVVSKSRIIERDLSSSSLMPEGLLDALNDREKLELLKFLIEN